MTDRKHEIQRKTIFSASYKRANKNTEQNKQNPQIRPFSRSEKKIVYIAKSANNLVYKFLQFPQQQIPRRQSRMQKSSKKDKRNFVKQLLQDLPQMKTSSILQAQNVTASNEMRQHQQQKTMKQMEPKKQKVVRQVSILSISSTKSFHQSKINNYINYSNAEPNTKRSKGNKAAMQVQQKVTEDFNNSHYNNQKYINKNKVKTEPFVQKSEGSFTKPKKDNIQHHQIKNGHTRLGTHAKDQIKRSKTQMKNQEPVLKQIRQHKNYFILADHFKQIQVQKQFKRINPDQLRRKLQNSYLKFKLQYCSPPQIKINPFRIPKIPNSPKNDQSLTEYIRCAKDLGRSMNIKIDEISVLIRKFKNCITFKIQQNSDFVIWNFDGKLYIGGWKELSEGDGFKEGFGIQFTSNYCYRGGFSSGKRSGQGIAQYYNGNVYEGQWKLGKMEGKGIFFDKSKASYFQGCWQNGQQKGKGILKYSKKHYYVGWFSNSEKSGNGTEFFENGDIYEGSYDKGMRNGHGIFYSHTGQAYAGNFKNSLKYGKGLLLTNKYSQSKQKMQQYYYGQFVQGMMSGYGIKRKLDGTYYYGYFYNNKQHGPGFIQESKISEQKVYNAGSRSNLNKNSDEKNEAPAITVSGIWRNGQLIVSNKSVLEPEASLEVQKL